MGEKVSRFAKISTRYKPSKDQIEGISRQHRAQRDDTPVLTEVRQAEPFERQHRAQTEESAVHESCCGAHTQQFLQVTYHIRPCRCPLRCQRKRTH